MKGKFKIKSEVSEIDLVEWCLNLHHSGVDYTLILVLHAFAKGWKIDKLRYYKKLIENE